MYTIIYCDFMLWTDEVEQESEWKNGISLNEKLKGQ